MSVLIEKKCSTVMEIEERVSVLEEKIKKLTSHNNDYTVSASLTPKTCPICDGDGEHRHNGQAVPCSFCDCSGQVFV